MRIGELVRRLRDMPAAAAIAHLVGSHDLDRPAAENLVRYLDDQAKTLDEAAALRAAGFAEPILVFTPATLTAHSIAIPLAFLLVTFLHVVVGELAPKSLALQFPETLALWIAWPMRFFNRLFWPLVWLLNGAFPVGICVIKGLDAAVIAGAVAVAIPVLALWRRNESARTP